MSTIAKVLFASIVGTESILAFVGDGKPERDWLDFKGCQEKNGEPADLSDKEINKIWSKEGLGRSLMIRRSLPRHHHAGANKSEHEAGRFGDGGPLPSVQGHRHELQVADPIGELRSMSHRYDVIHFGLFRI
jgi:hypothetical protein